MPEKLSNVAKRVVAGLEAGAVEMVRLELGASLAGWDPEPWISERWRPRLDELAGPHRSVTGAWLVNDVMARVAFVGDRGQAFVSVLLDAHRKVAGLAIDPDESDGQFWVVVGCTKKQSKNLEAFYSALTRGPIGFGEGGSRPPRWRDPSRPAQIHLDVAVADLDKAEQEVTALGAHKLEEFANWRVYADPAGHPFCLYPGLTDPTDRIGALLRIVIDCSEPTELARFWAGLLQMPREVEVSASRVVIARDDSVSPMIACQRIENYQPPRWPHPEFPAQMHLDLGFDDRRGKEQRAVELGAGLQPPQGGSCPVYTDPAGHPFCLCYKGE